jgi:hypothetical protein
MLRNWRTWRLLSAGNAHGRAYFVALSRRPRAASAIRSTDRARLKAGVAPLSLHGAQTLLVHLETKAV